MFLYQLAYNTANTKTQQISSGNLLADKNSEILDLKNAISMIVMFVRTYSLQNNVWSYSTLERLDAIKAKLVISENTVDEIIFAYNFLMKLRLKNQVNLLENNLPLSNALNTKNLIDIELTILKKVLSLLPVYQNKISADFRIST